MVKKSKRSAAWRNSVPDMPFSEKQKYSKFDSEATWVPPSRIRAPKGVSPGPIIGGRRTWIAYFGLKMKSFGKKKAKMIHTNVLDYTTP